jgi:acyl carrier protein
MSDMRTVTMTGAERLRLDEVEQKVCDIASEQLGIPRERISPSVRIIEDLHCDSLDMVELLMEVEEAFGITLPEDSANPVYKAIFTRQPFRLSDLAELAYLQQGTGTADRKAWRQARYLATPSSSPAFSQFDGRWEISASQKQGLFEPLETDGTAAQFRRRSDGMRCLLIPLASVEIGCGAPDAPV